ncbi:uncharacterized protein ASPGLDRAFT_69819 [Aspergillus glaucus CBS 516.65]|uniref:Aconitate hydratase, mitochondrial n=1 Tax=Aspergillus glaucus CBS 516.65 TaxID=1160497 RepID=A0A1L9V7X6_ASPGL|nr:hypothetical protein ASPGLDRAFT_69819 [Aspergillus glaucus CBS 516.65]OJJ79942.1 hypothetical protein ASPGLDRAFT_69819 [Aspergillus glaucus CBS 516.65]
MLTRLLRRGLKRPLTYAEKVLYSHLDDEFDDPITRGKSQLRLRPMRIACQDTTAQMALIQFISAGLDTSAVPTTVHCDHLIVSRDGEAQDLPRALDVHKEVYEFLESACQKYKMGFWRPGAGIIHQIVLENYTFPGGMMVGTDSHTPNAGGMGMIAISVGGADAVDVMAGLPWELMALRVLGVRLNGELSGWATPKDIINKLVGTLSVKGGTGSIIEYFGPGTQTLSATGMATVCNMGAETGATTSIFPYSPSMSKYLHANHHPDMAQDVDSVSQELCANEGAEYDQIIDIDLSKLEPHINGPFTSNLATPLFRLGTLTAGLIGSCTNSSFEDLSRAASTTQQATRETLEKSEILQTFEEIGVKMLPNACGPCCGSWDRTDTSKGMSNSIITSYNRKFSGRLDPNPKTNIFLASPEVVMIKVFSQNLGFNPSADTLTTPAGEEFSFNPPTGDSLPGKGYLDSDAAYQVPPAGDLTGLDVQIDPSSQRLQKLAPFTPWSGKDFEDCLILIKTKGKCTTDHITPSGPQLRFRGHLENISNTLIGAVNAENDKANTVHNQLTQQDVPGTARHYQTQGHPWPCNQRYLGSVAIIAKSFARNEANLKKQGMLALTLANEADYDRIWASHRVSIIGLAELAPGKPLTLQVKSIDGKSWEAKLSHTFMPEQIEYFKAGSA